MIPRSTALNVTEVRSGEHPVRDTIYVAPANRNLAFELGAFRLDDDQTAAPHPSINAFFTALALEWGSRAVGVILSGNGEDGARGLRAIKAAGGHALAQTPESAAYPAMPRAAIATDLVIMVNLPDRSF